MFDVSKANEAQRKAISTVKGPLLITAGPGTGKTYTLVQRIIYLIQECGACPEQIFVATFTEKAAKELITRITNELYERDITVNLNEMYVGTFHSICLRIIKEHLEYTRLKKNYKMADDFDISYMVNRDLKRFEDIDGLFSEKEQADKKEFLLKYSPDRWERVGSIVKAVSSVREELVDVDKMLSSEDKRICVLGKLVEEYEKLLAEQNFLDFTAIQTETYRLLTENPDILREIQSKIEYIMIDEYQDTNYIQEQLVFLLAGEKKNICVVGDDDQGLYRFRGATIRNILEFPQKFEDGTCKQIALVENYRSNSDIVDFYNKWMNTTEIEGQSVFEWGKYRFRKEIKAIRGNVKSPAVVKLSAVNDEDAWCEKICGFIKGLKESEKISDYNQIAFLYNSVKNPKSIHLARYLEANGINVYSPRSDMFFERDEIKLVIGILLCVFPDYTAELEEGKHDFVLNFAWNREDAYSPVNYLKECAKLAVRTAQGHDDLRTWMIDKAKVHTQLKKNADYGFTGLLYQLFSYKPFADILQINAGSGVNAERPLRNLAMFTELLSKFEHLYGIDVITAKNISDSVKRLFNNYLCHLYKEGLGEFEDESEYAPSGCVSFMTIHQSKGLEFPIVIVDSLYNFPRNRYSEVDELLAENYYHRKAFEPFDRMKYFDFWRLYYTAFSRPQNLLVLTCNEKNGTPSKYFRSVYKELADVNDDKFDINDFEFDNVKSVELKQNFSFTSHISVYETCPQQYKFYKEFGFTPVRSGSMLFGSLVHETIEDIHKAAIRGEYDKITEENAAEWFNTNYVTLSKIEHTYLAEAQKAKALSEVINYLHRNEGKWQSIQQAEVDVSLVKPDYILQGKIDLIKGEGGTVEIVDFKATEKPDMFDEVQKERIEMYHRQLNVYAYLVEERTGHKVSKMQLYFTGEENGVPVISFNNTRTAVEGTISAFDDTVHKIMRKEFDGCAKESKTCTNCDFRVYCGKK